MNFTEKELNILKQNGMTDEDGQPVGEFIRLDESKKTVIGSCVHQWRNDAPNHKICDRCGYGKYI